MPRKKVESATGIAVASKRVKPILYVLASLQE